MNITTKQYGNVEIEESQIINFEEGLPGYPTLKKYVILKSTETKSLCCYLQSLDDPNVSLPITVPFVFFPDYKPEISDEDFKKIDITDTTGAQNLSVFNVLVVPTQVKETTINLKAPIVINEKTKKGGQFFATNKEYGVKHKLTELVSMYD